MSDKTRKKRSREAKGKAEKAEAEAGKAGKPKRVGEAEKSRGSDGRAARGLRVRGDERPIRPAGADERDEKLDEASGAIPGPPPERKATMHPDIPHLDVQQDLRDSAAAIAPVTEAMMDHAAHEAAVLADGVARNTATVEHTAEQAAAVARDAAEGPVQTAVETAGRAVDAVQDATRSAADVAARASDGAVEVVGSIVGDADRAAKRGAEVARDALSASGDALIQYNAKVMEMVRANLASTTELFSALVQAKSVPEAMSLNADHFRRRMEALTTQGRDLATLAQQIALDALRPFEGGTGR